MKALDPKENEVYKFLGCKQAEEIDKKNVMERVKHDVEQRTKMVNEGLYDKNLVKAINCRAIPVAAYVMNICNLTGKEIEQLDKSVKTILREHNMHGRQSSDECLYLKRQLGGRGFKSFKDVYRETKVRVACYMIYSESPWIKEAWKWEVKSTGISIKREAEAELSKININIEFREQEIRSDGEQLEGTWKEIWKKLKRMIKEKTEKERLDQYRTKKMQSEVHTHLDEEGHGWLQSNVETVKMASIIAM